MKKSIKTNEYPNNALTNNFKLLRRRKGLTNINMADIMQVSAGTYSNWENGRSDPSIKDMNRLAEFFGVPVDFLFKLNTNRTFKVTGEIV